MSHLFRELKQWPNSRNEGPNRVSRMGIPQWQRAAFLIDKFEEAFQAGRDIAALSGEIRKATEAKYKWCHDCLLLAVYGMYKNGFIENTSPRKSAIIDYVGFSGRESKDIAHAFDALKVLESDRRVSATDLKHRLGGEQSIYSFVVHYFNNGLFRN